MSRPSKNRRPPARRAARQPVATPTARASRLALGLSTAMLVPLSSLAQTAPAPAAPETQLAPVKVKDTRIDPNPNAETGVPYKARTSGDSRHTRPLAETPQNITVITKPAIDDAGYTDLKQILDAQPGITLGTGENGNAFGDRYIIRGQEARSDVFVDGLRDPGMTTRESFAIEQLEISRGPNSSFAGRGTAGGAINAITKQATLDYDFTRLSTGLGTDRHTRVTLDGNHIFSDQFALRANVLYGREDVPDRAPAERSRKGLALSGLYEVNSDLNVTVDYYGFRGHDRPDLGSYLVGDPPDRRPAKGVPVYAQMPDFLDSDVDTVTARVNYRIDADRRLTSLTRYGTSDNGYVVTGARATTGDPAGLAYPTASLSTHQGWQEVKYFAHQTNLRWDTQLAGRKHEFIFGVEYTQHHVLNGVYDVVNRGATNCMVPARGGGVAPGYCTVGSDGKVVNGLNTLLARDITKGHWDTDWKIKTLSLSAMDTFDLTDRWSAFAGLRADRFDYELGTYGIDRNTGLPVQAAYDYSDTLVNGHLGLTYKVHPQGMVYASYASASDINGGESDVGTSSGYGGAVIYNGSIAGAKPERSQSFELGTKWNLLDNSLLATAALFQITKSDVMEGADYDSVGTFNTGKNRVRGLELALTGELTERLTAQVGVTLMKAKVLESATAANVGKTLANFAERSASALLKYQVTDALALGGAVKYESQRYGGQPDTAAGFDPATGHYSQPVPSYTVFDLFGSYRINKSLDLRVNLLNVTNEDYYLAVYRSGSFLYKGDGRALRVTLDYEF